MATIRDVFSPTTSPGAARATWSPRTSFWLVVLTQVLLFAGSNLPTPLFPIYEHHYGFGSGMVTCSSPPTWCR
jgi:hypothetical protein